MLSQPEFGRRLRELRMQQGRSRADLIGSGMSAAYLSRLESGARPPTQRAVAYLAERLGITEDAFTQPPKGDLTDILATLTLSTAKYDSHMCTALTKALEETPDADDNTRWQALAQLARMHLALGDFIAEHHVLTQLREISDELSRPALQAHARIRLARCARDLGELTTARHEVRQALTLAENHRLRVPAADLQHGKLLLASVEAELGDLAEATRLSKQACTELEHPNGPLAAETYWTTATVSTRRGDYHQAAQLMEQALSAISSQEDLTMWLRLRLAAASLALQTAPPKTTEAQNRLNQARTALELIGSPRHHQEYNLLHIQLALYQGTTPNTHTLCEKTKKGQALLTYRDRIRLETLTHLVHARSGTPNARHKACELANEVQKNGMPDLAAELWRTIALSDTPPRKQQPATQHP
ncbi:MAG: helix-turn-helix domain-containing protein [Streptomycetaceae bacterium]|nr:helix-turn-helix domain-containing protein [Streptomycetaceae bacterium]